MRVGDIVQRVQSLYSKGVESDDSRLTRRHIYNKMVTVRSSLIYRKLNKNQYISKWNYDTLSCVELIKVEAHECPCIPPIGCQILRTKEKLPKPINSLSKHLIDSVTSIDGSVIFDETTWKGNKWSDGDKYTSMKPDFFIKDDYLYITVTRKLKLLTIIGLFNDPVEVGNFPSFCDGSSSVVVCRDSPLDAEFNIDEDLIDVLVEFSVKELVFAFNQSREDTTNDGRDSVIENSK